MEKLFELTHPQKRVLLTQLLHEDEQLCNIGGYVCFHGNVDYEKMKFALRVSVRKLDCFSIRLSKTTEDYRQYFVDEEPVVGEWKIKDTENIDESIRQKAGQIVNIPFNLFDNPLYRIIAYKGKGDIVGYIICCHHIIFDGWSVKIFTEQVSNIYNHLDYEVGSYRKYMDMETKYLASERSVKDCNYWENMLSTSMKKQSVIGDNICCHGIREEYKVSDDLRCKFEKLGNKWYGINTLLCACFVLADYFSGRNRIISMSNYNRQGRKMKNTAGMFTNTNLLAVPCEKTSTFTDLMLLTRKTMNKTIYHQQWPYDLLGFRYDKQPFFYNINCYNTKLDFPLGSASGKYYEIYSGGQDIPMQLILNAWDKQWKICVDMNDAFFHRGDGVAIMQFIADFMEMLDENPGETIGGFKERLTQRELIRQRYSFLKMNDINYTLTERMGRLLKNSMVSRDVVIMGDGNTSNRQLAKLIWGAMDHYRRVEIRSGEHILIYLPNCIQYIAYVLAAVAKGICFTPLDVSMQINQVETIYLNAKAKALVVNANISTIKMNLMCVESGLGEFRQLEHISDTKPAYLLYTSGSTGVPKGVLVSRGALAVYLNWAESCYGNVSFYLYSSPAFDLSLTSLFLPLTAQGRVVVADALEQNLYGIVFNQKVMEVNAIKATPSNLALLMQQNTEKLQLNTIICGGEELSINLAAKLQERFGEHCRIYNEYGPTECTIGCMCHLYNQNSDTGETVSIGNAAPGSRVYVIDKGGNMCGVGKAGEIYIAGDQLATEYWGLSEENDKHFIKGVMGEKRLYRTGDLARYCIDGTLQYIGRLGRQCKINGYRIELESIERTLKAVPGIRNAVVWTSKKGKGQLFSAVETDIYTQSQLADAVLERLPPYCVPHYFYICSKLPITKNGKIDIELLTQKEVVQSLDKRKMLECVLREVLHFQGDMKDFDYLVGGGDSIKALRIITDLEKRGYHISLGDILDYPKFNEMVNCLMYTDNDTTEEKEEYALPIHLKFFSETCSNFEDYTHTLVFGVNRFIGKDETEQLNTKLRITFPSLNAIYKNGRIKELDIIQPANWKYLRDLEQQTRKFFDSLRDTKSLFHLEVYSNEIESKICFSIHHILVDGVSWNQILYAVEAILNKEELPRHMRMEIWRVNLDIKWQSQIHMKLNNSYHCVNRESRFERNVSTIKFYETVRKVLYNDDKWSVYTLLCDCNGREFTKLIQSENIGCYSVLVPINVEGGMVETQLASQIGKGQIDVGSTLGFRVNFIGDISDMIPSSFTLMTESLEYSLESCSGYGCLAEITGMITRNSLFLYFSWRNREISNAEAEIFIEKLDNELKELNGDNLLRLELEEIDSLFD